MKFNPPPNWPAPPEGWTPTPGWQPDPSWPAPPPGWQVWVDDGPALTDTLLRGAVVGAQAMSSGWRAWSDGRQDRAAERALTRQADAVTQMREKRLRSLADSAARLGIKIDARNGVVASAKERHAMGSIQGASAVVESAGQVQQRITATRLLAVGVFALAIPKKTSDRVVFIVIEGEGFAFSVEVPSRREADAHRWVREFNAAAH